MTSHRAALALVAAALVLGACNTPSADTGGGPSTLPQSSVTVTVVPQATATEAPTPEPSPSDIGVGGPQQTPPNVNPCTLLTTAEASAVMGKPLGEGVVVQVDQDVECTWKSGLTAVKLILAPPAPDAATAQAYWDAAQGQLPVGVQTAQLSNFDQSAYFSGAGGGISFSALFVIQDRWFFDLFCEVPACTQVASLGGAEHVAGRLPAP
ncbi:MAG TPA: hypothetical protein VGI98_02930 [Candidatus Limnocylindrales bacterium]|jgi:hypothetical protein